ncbi:MAG TPA: DUF3015 domain-containing protein [Desulfobulbus sp.]|nr:DUF3015 domain-containing protein [Desulfobulbus sp.]
MHLLLFRLISLALLSALLTGCGTTSAPTESSTKTTDKTVNSTMDASSSSTPGKNSSTARAEQFSRENFARIKADMAVGGGEHLAALAVLLDVPPKNEERFFALTRTQYAALYATSDTDAGRMLTRLNHAMAADPFLSH